MIPKSDLTDFSVTFNQPLSDYTFTRVGGPADILAQPKSIQELSDLIHLAHKSATPITVLGNASNLIVRDGGIRGLVILLTHLDRVNLAGYTLEVEAGANLKTVTQIAQKHALTGLEFASGIPGSIGGAIYMNAGAYGGEISDVLASVKVFDIQKGAVRVLNKEDLSFGYRYSKIRDQALIVLSAKFELVGGDPSQIQHEMDRLTALRAAKQPLEYPSCGSVFKRPPGDFAGRLIMNAGCQGAQIGGVQVSTKHAGFMVNLGQGTGADYEALIHQVIKQVQEKTGITLEPEVRIIGEKEIGN